MEQRHYSGVSDRMKACIEECQTCHSVCLQTITHCLHMGGKHADPNHIGLLQDCAQICQTSADFMLRNSQLKGLTCGVCAEVCRRCAESCEHIGDDVMMQQCAQACRSCAQSCQEMTRIS